jgi:hypothetical protein
VLVRCHDRRGPLRETKNEAFLSTFNQAPVKQIRKSRLVIEGTGGESVIQIEATTKPEEIGLADLVNLFVKLIDPLNPSIRVLFFPILIRHKLLIEFQRKIPYSPTRNSPTFSLITKFAYW